MRSLSWGSRGPAVQLLQLALTRAGLGELETDGVFGQATRAALLEFQRREGLAPDGVAGPRTHQALLPWYTGYRSYRARPGDSFWSLARRYDSSVEALATANPRLRPQAIPVGAELVIPLPFRVVPTKIDWCADLLAYCLRGLSARYPYLRTGQIGRSTLGRPLWRLSLGQGENRVLYNAGHHANEWITTPVLMCFAEELAEAAALGGTVYGVSAAEILSYASVCLAPSVNPDGMDLVTGELQAGDAFSRAMAIARDYPRYPFPRGWKANLRGVDLNLQYPAGWEQAREIKFRQGIVSPAPADYVGSAPLSAAESRALHQFTLSYDPALTLSLHTQGEVIYWRYQDYEVAGARQIAQLFAQASGYQMEETPYESGFAGYKDWFIQVFARPGFTLELGQGENPLPMTDFPKIYQDTRPILVLGALVT